MEAKSCAQVSQIHVHRSENIVDQVSLSCVFWFQKAGLLTGDLITAVGNDDVKWSNRDDAIRRIQRAGNKLHLTVVTPFSEKQVELNAVERQNRLQHHAALMTSAEVEQGKARTSKSLDRMFNRRVELRSSNERSKSKTRANKKQSKHKFAFFDH